MRPAAFAAPTALLAVWLGFFTPQHGRVACALAERVGDGAGRADRRDSVGDVGVLERRSWHVCTNARALAPNVWILLALHVPTLAAVSIIDSAVSRTLSSHPSSASRHCHFLFTVVYYADFDVVNYLAIVAVAEALLIRRALVERQRRQTARSFAQPCATRLPRGAAAAALPVQLARRGFGAGV